ncbi:MAG: HD domain-containing protein [Symbiobacterium sp.]|uniref:HD domain-containing protein n=1 Tax=Symbiobacterium sp. TaxID=1971213 RepID=UPI003463B76B
MYSKICRSVGRFFYGFGERMYGRGGTVLAKQTHEIRDPIHNFIRLDSDERRVLDSRPFQRLRYIHQLAMSYLVYPGATHRRFEHSLGVMELASRIFDVVTHPANVTDEIREILPEITQTHQLPYWRRVVRMAALCHDIGHLPFSHAAEKELLPGGWDHERLTKELILSEEMREIWQHMTPPLRAEDVAKIAVGPRKYPEQQFTNWEAILSEIIVGDAFGADRMDYLLRDSYHAGVAYGRFDHFRLIDTLRLLPSTPTDDQTGIPEPALGVEEGGLQSAEALLLARYFMYSQVYLHPVRRIYDIHLKDFLREWLPNGRFSTDLDQHLLMTDNEVISAIRKAAEDAQAPGHDPAMRIVQRKHFRVLYRRHPGDVEINPEAGRAVYSAAVKEFGSNAVRHDQYTQKGSAPDFPVLIYPNMIVSAFSLSPVLRGLPVYAIDYVFVDPDKLVEAERWLRNNREKLIQFPYEGEAE